MAEKNKFQGEKQSSNAQKDPDDWVTKDEPSTGAQRSYLHTLATEAGEDVDENLTKGEASKKIEELQQKTGRGAKAK
ncbi:MAG: DUF3072 domain-containing protein [Verrucomicrobia bacterium]|nr:DUF3072 domain-containing protein [Verrucomicrobiota bacterium]